MGQSLEDEELEVMSEWDKLSRLNIPRRVMQLSREEYSGTLKKRGMMNRSNGPIYCSFRQTAVELLSPYHQAVISS